MLRGAESQKSMKKQTTLFWTKTLILVSVALGLLPFTAQPGHAAEDRYYCGKINDTPTTMMRTPRRDVPLVMWLTKTFGSTWTPENRCDLVSKQFQAAHEANQKFLTIGKKNDFDIICAARVAGGNCERQLLTIPKSMNPSASLNALGNITSGLASAAFLNRPHVRSDYESYSDGWGGESRPYLNLEELRKIIGEQRTDGL
jgi:hypothetical protein